MRRALTVTLTIAILAGPPAVIAQPADGWIRIDASAPFTDRSGVRRSPGCSGGPVITDTPAGQQLVAADTAYSFFVRHGNPEKLAILFDGGGACWDAATCIGSVIAGRPLYSQTVDETIEELNAIGGIGDPLNAANPISDYTQVFIPYCSADLHAGDAVTRYDYATGDGGTVSWDIHHRGADNVAAVLEWLQTYYETEVGHAPSEVFTVGASAGGYGALINYPAIAARLPRGTRMQLLIDAANGVMSQSVYDTALSPEGNWAVWDNLSPVLAAAFSSGPGDLMKESFKSLGWNYPDTRIGQYTTAYDAVQIGFYNIARHPGAIERWLDPIELLAAGFEWTLRARTDMILTAWQVPNYRYYVGAGIDHTIVADDKFYSEDTAQSRQFADWVGDMITARWPWFSNWRNVSCAPACVQ
jgi:hypothetical protein